MGATHTDTSTSIGANIKRRRVAAGLSQEELAFALEVSRQTVSNWETSRTIPDAQSLKLIAQQLSCSADELLGADVPGSFPAIDRTRGARRELLGVTAAILSLYVLAGFMSALHIEDPSAAGLTTFEALRFGALAVLVAWSLSIQKRCGVRTMGAVVQLITLVPHGVSRRGDRILQLLGRWWWSLWFGLFGLSTLLGACVSIAGGNPNLQAALIVSACMLAPFAIAFTWERNQPERRQ
ncbi:helix-turn-helix transcriptional regulator [Collinsella sp. An2]|uniref:helix-turn-helix domain-containing protein n=1 Tax=Collinsella sp. An2 TaxID=1965585 RepID=UPI001EF72E82|nr:helix-turn-helix transcriptional regulator [Collinsella sp. An2]